MTIKTSTATTKISHDDAFNEIADQVDPFSCSASAFSELAESAPCDHSRGFLAGVKAVRQQIDIITGPAFA